MRKTFVLDTNVLIHDPLSIHRFPGNDVVIPLTVIEELDNFKKRSDEVGKNARKAVRELDSLRSEEGKNLNTGVDLENDSTIRTEVGIKKDMRLNVSLDNNDNKIILCGCLLKEQGLHVVFVSKDLAARVKAIAFGLEAEDYENLKVAYDNIYTGIVRAQVPKKSIDILLKDGFLKYDQIDSEILMPHFKDREKPFPNEYFVFTCPENSQIICKYNAEGDVWEPIKPLTEQLWGIQPRNVEQQCALDMILDDKIKLVTLIGTAGTGKTLLALAGGLRQVFDEGCYKKILISRPIIPLGRDIGYLPGSKEEKLFNWMQPIYDNLEFLCASSSDADSDALRWLTESKRIEMEAVTYIRGRSLPKMYIIVDEAQNLTPHEVKTIISRAGEDTKVILTGDPTQIDNPYLDKDSNALTFTVGKFQEYGIYGHVMLERTERSELAALAAKIMWGYDRGRE